MLCGKDLYMQYLVFIHEKNTSIKINKDIFIRSPRLGMANSKRFAQWLKHWNLLPK